MAILILCNKKKITYFDYDGYVYWHIENIINRCFASETYWVRKKRRETTDMSWKLKLESLRRDK